MAVRGFLIIRAKRGYKDFNNSTYVRYDELCGFLFMGWGLHYFPFYLMSRQLFLHHYFPALYFAVLLFCAVFDILTSSLKSKYRLQIAAAFLAVAILNYSHFMPLTYATPWTQDACRKSMWLKTWDFGCSDFHTDYSKYSTVSGMTPTSAPLITIGGEQEGRAPVVIQDHVKQPEQVESATSAVPNQPAPGPDVFERPEGQHSQSVDAPQPQKEPESHEVTNDEQKSAEKAAPPVPPPQAQEIPLGGAVHQGEKETAKDASDTTSDSHTASASEQVTTTQSEAAAQTAAAGPKDEAEVERDRVMEELFGKEEN